MMGRRTRSDAERTDRRERGVLFGSGLVGGEGLFGVVIAGVVFYQSVTSQPGETPALPMTIGAGWASMRVTSVAAAVVFAGLVLLFARRCVARSD